MVREFFYGGDRFRATVHGRPGKEEVFIVQVLEDDEEGSEISLDRFEDAGNDPEAPLESVLVMLVDRMRVEHGLTAAQAGAAFAWSESKVRARVHNGLQHH
jgi:DNA-directed RNA polymerase specialized sigma24 family protein